MDTGWELVASQCTVCHSSKLVIQNRGDEEHWVGLIRWMQKTQNLWPIDPESEKTIVGYLARNYGAEFFGRRRPIPADLLPPDPSDVTRARSDRLGRRMRQRPEGSPDPDALARHARVDEAKEALAPLKRSLMGALGSAMKEGGPTRALEVCHTQAQELTAAASTTSAKVGRTSARLRNAANQGPAWVAPLLEELQTSPRVEGAFRTAELEGDGFGYVEPIYVGEGCLQCHGENVDPALAAEIDQRYPDDQARGFKLGDFRGVFWAELAAPPAKAP